MFATLVLACVRPSGEELAPAFGDTGSEAAGEDASGAGTPGEDETVEDDAAEDDGEALPEEYEGPDGSEPGASWDPEGVEAALQAALDDLRSWNAAGIPDVYDRAMAAATADCPNLTRAGGDERWIARCETAAGARYDGYALLDAYADQREGNIAWDGAFYYLAAVVETPEGWTLGGGGSARVQTGEGDDGDATFQAWYSFLQGTLTWDGPGSAGTWLAGSVTPNVGMTARYYRAQGVYTLSAEGAVALEGGALTALTFRDLYVSRGNEHNACEREPEGTLELRDAAGAWYELTFDRERCDGCGEVTYAGTSVGELCVDVGVLTDWGASPW